MQSIRGVLARCAALGLLALGGCVTRPGSASFAQPPQGPALYGLEGARVIYIAEKHDEVSHHQFQEKIIRSLQRESVTVGMEMIDVTQQAPLDDYLTKRTSWREFESRTQFDRGWGRTSSAYRRILSWCRRNEVPVMALNAPSTVTRKLARGKPLTADEKQLVPSFPEPPGGFKQFRAAMADHASTGSLRLYYEAQRAWDQTMAGRILAWLPNHPGTLVVLLGRFHADPRTGVPWYVARKTDARQVILYPVRKQEQ
ncbi:MAG TPA: ChaN family lipoprotein [Terrimicrobiaceae bacterium]